MRTSKMWLFVLSAMQAASMAFFTVPVHAQSPTTKVNIQHVVEEIGKNINTPSSQLPLTIEAPMEVAAKVCGVPMSMLQQQPSGTADCVAKMTSSELEKVVKQKVRVNKQ